MHLSTETAFDLHLKGRKGTVTEIIYLLTDWALYVVSSAFITIALAETDSTYWEK